MKYLFFGLFIILIILLLVNYCRKTHENFEVKYQLINGNQLQDNRFQIYNQNYNKAWKDPPMAYNSPIVQSYGTSFNDMYKMNQYIFNDFKKEQVDEFVSKSGGLFKVIGKDYLDDYTPFDLYNINKGTWYNRYDWDPDYILYEKYVRSDFAEVNTINKFFLHMWNQYWFDFITDYVKRKTILYKPFFILKHRIVSVKSSKEKVGDNPKFRLFETVVIVTRDNGILAFEFFLRGLFKLGDKHYELDKFGISYIANYSLDKVLLRGNLNKDNTYFNLNPLWANDTSLSSAQARTIYEKDKKKIFEMRNFLDYSHACFTYDKSSKNPYSVPIFATDKNDCENAYDIIGYKKPSGVWDRPCQKDAECMFYKENKNYDNTYGRCINGKCEMPSNMKNLGYHYYINAKSTKPLCYNCESKEWLPNTKLGFCCDEQKNNKKKYGFLKSPDYAFEGDSLTRYNAYVQEKCKMKPNYDNIFKDTKVWKIDCKGFLDSYLVKS